MELDAIFTTLKIKFPSKVLVQNIAIADLGYTLVIILPTIFTTTTMSDTWTLGNFTCEAIGVLQFSFGVGNIVMICALNICKLTCLLSPLQSTLRSLKSGYILVSILWMLSLVYPAQLVLLKRDMSYEPLLYRCMTTDRDGTIWTTLDTVNSGIFMLIPLLGILITTIWLLIIISRITYTNRQGVLVVLTVSSVFIISWCPLLSYNIYHLFSYPSETHYKIGVFFIFINAASNPLLYLLTSRSFKDFLLTKVQKCSRALKKTVTSRVQDEEQNTKGSSLTTGNAN